MFFFFCGLGVFVRKLASSFGHPCNSLRKLNLPLLATTFESVWPGLNILFRTVSYPRLFPRKFQATQVQSHIVSDWKLLAASSTQVASPSSADFTYCFGLAVTCDFFRASCKQHKVTELKFNLFISVNQGSTTVF